VKEKWLLDIIIHIEHVENVQTGGSGILVLPAPSRRKTYLQEV